MNLNILGVMMIFMTHFQRGHFFLMFIGNIELLTGERMKLAITIMGMVICIFTKPKTQTGDMNFVFNMMMEKLTFGLVQLTVT
tara:strand:- start:190 stop:438 length:249 start_codon:yes stop_codon:yes gene_type:complete